jgi:glucosamine--fructose-6-phosphate aminotransferase (isomerizing)
MGSAMARETAEAPDAVARLLDREFSSMCALGRRLAERAPPVVATCARGSSDHAAGYFKYLLEIGAGLPVASLGPSIASVYAARLHLPGGALISISQSGGSPDLVALQAAARAGGAVTVAIVNVTESPLAREADIVVPLHAGVESSVAATKSFITSAVAAATLVAAWTNNPALLAAIRDLPATLGRSLHADWSAAETAIAPGKKLFVLGRGPALPMAQEIALKAKETAGIHAEAFSTAEVMHGPLRLVQNSLPVLALLPDDAASAGSREALARIGAAGGAVFTTATTADAPGTLLAAAPTGHAMTDPISMALSFYVLIERICRRHGLDPDHPAHLRKVTETM